MFTLSTERSFTCNLFSEMMPSSHWCHTHILDEEQGLLLAGTTGVLYGIGKHGKGKGAAS